MFLSLSSRAETSPRAGCALVRVLAGGSGVDRTLLIAETLAA
jgi:hypothetical protein